MHILHVTFFFLQLSLTAIDTFYPNNIGFASVRIKVIRNPSSPVFDRASYTETVRESVAAGSLIVKLSATDDDGVGL